MTTCLTNVTRTRRFSPVEYKRKTLTHRLSYFVLLPPSTLASRFSDEHISQHLPNIGDLVEEVVPNRISRISRRRRVKMLEGPNQGNG